MNDSLASSRELAGKPPAIQLTALKEASAASAFSGPFSASQASHASKPNFAQYSDPSISL